MSLLRAWLVSALGCALACEACAGSGRDAVPESRDVRGVADVADAAPPVAPDAYVYVAKRPHGIVALAEARGMSTEIAARAIDHLADALDTCAARLASEQKLVAGAARVVAQIGVDGAVGGLVIKAAPGGGVAANLLTCVISPLRATTFPTDADAGARGLAIETEWGHGASVDAGMP